MTPAETITAVAFGAFLGIVVAMILISAVESIKEGARNRNTRRIIEQMPSMYQKMLLAMMKDDSDGHSKATANPRVSRDAGDDRVCVGER